MNRIVPPGPRAGCVTVPASKSQAHRLLICAALGEGETLRRCDGVSDDITATIRCLNAMGAEIAETPDGLRVRPRTSPVSEAPLRCGESGSTLRCLIPVLGALGQAGPSAWRDVCPLAPSAP